MACDFDCLKSYKCGPLQTPYSGPVFGQDGIVFAPFVELTIGDLVLTVGNNSSLPSNLACIRSFEFGFSNGQTGWGATFEIVDNGGVVTRQIIRAIHKNLANAKEDAKQTFFDFGWIYKDDFGAFIKKSASKLSNVKLQGVINFIESKNDKGNIILNLTIAAPNGSLSNLPQGTTIGDTKNKVSLKQALTKLFTDYPPFLNPPIFKDQDGNIGFQPNQDKNPFQFANSTTSAPGEGPLNAWPINNANALEVAREWLKNQTSINKKGFQIIWDCTAYAYVIHEDPNNKKAKRVECCPDLTKSIGTFIVNGGNCSNVLEFNTNIKWNPSGSIGRVAAPPGAAKGENNVDVQDNPNKDRVGNKMIVVVPQNEWNITHPDEMAQKALDGNIANFLANHTYEAPLSGFEVEMKILGDPTLASLIDSSFLQASVVYINPFHLNDEPTWISSPTCNSILSNSNYQILAINHQISGGSFVTTLKMILVKPNIDVDRDLPLGLCGIETFNENPGSTQPADPSVSTLAQS